MYEVADNGVKLGNTIIINNPLAYNERFRNKRFTVKEITWKHGVVLVDDVNGGVLPSEYQIVGE